MYTLTIFDHEGRKIGSAGPFGNVPSARQAMLDDANIIDLPNEEPFHVPALNVLEGWFVGWGKAAREYNIGMTE